MRLLIALRAFFAAWKNPGSCKSGISAKTESPATGNIDHSHLRLLANLQQSARLVDFFKEDISECTDAQIGAAVRKIHEDCRKKLEELVTIRPIFEEPEGSKIQVPSGYDPTMIKLVGNIRNEPPFEGKLVHKGWKAHKRSLPKRDPEQGSDVLHPAEVQIG